MLSNFFIERPIFANVIAIVTVLIGAVALWALPVEQYPEITPPTVRVSSSKSTAWKTCFTCRLRRPATVLTRSP